MEQEYRNKLEWINLFRKYLSMSNTDLLKELKKVGGKVNQPGPNKQIRVYK